MSPLVPFDKHGADVADLESCGSTLITRAAEGLTNGKLTKHAYSPALTSVNGGCAPLVESADQAVRRGSQDVSAQLAWAAVVSHYWGTQVDDFNTEVDRITSALGNETSGHGASGSDTGDGKTADERARDDWWTAYRTYIEDGQTTTAAMLRDGPTPAHLQTAIDAGAMPPMQFDYSKADWWNGFLGIWLPPDGDGVDTGIWAGKTVMLGTTWYSSWYRNNRLMRYSPLPPLWAGRLNQSPLTRAYPSFSFSEWSRQAWQKSRPYNWQQRMDGHSVVQRAKWTKYAKVADRSFYALSFAAGTYDQWTRDATRTDLSSGEKVTRSATRGAVKLAGTYAGIESGAYLGAAIGSAIPGVGTVVGGMVGGVVGGVIGSGLADEVADYAVDGVTDAYNAIADSVDLSFWN